MSSSFASLISAVESLTTRGTVHKIYCRRCRENRDHDVPGPTRQFRDFFETHTPQISLKERRNKMYALRSGILHGTNLMAFDMDFAFGWDPPWWNEKQLDDELWGLTRIAVRAWLTNPSAVPPSDDVASRSGFWNSLKSVARAASERVRWH